MFVSFMRAIVPQQISTFRVVAGIVINDAFATAMLMLIHCVRSTVDVTGDHAESLYIL
jgi:hypothetical protein